MLWIPLQSPLQFIYHRDDLLVCRPQVATTQYNKYFYIPALQLQKQKNLPAFPHRSTSEHGTKTETSSPS